MIGCATIVRGTTKDIPLSSIPPGATVSIDGTSTYTTPITVELKRGRDHILTFSKDGYQTEQVTLQSVLGGTFAGNLLLGGIVGGAVDLASGSAYRLVPESVSVELRPLKPGEAAETVTKTSLTPEERLQNLERLHEQQLITDDEYKAMRKIILEELQNGKTT